MLPKKDMLPSARENILTNMYTQLHSVMAGGSDGNDECPPPTPGML
jgi:hypothetical protein